SCSLDLFTAAPGEAAEMGGTKWRVKPKSGVGEYEGGRGIRVMPQEQAHNPPHEAEESPAMNESTTDIRIVPLPTGQDVLSEVLRDGARRMLAQAIEAEAAA